MLVKRARLHALALLAAGMMIASACSALTPEDPAATLRAEREAYVAEATTIASNEIVQQTQVAESVVAAETRVREVEARNALLLATLQVVAPPTQQVVNLSGAVTPGLLATPAPPGSVISGTSGTPVPGGVGTVSTNFVEISTALTVRDSDGCADTVANAFAADVQRIYVTARAFNISAGTTMRVEWFYEGTSSFTESFTVDVSDDDFCLWFYIEPTEVAFSPGSWSVQLYANEQAIQPSASFTIGM